jgi:hypothetical protein
MARSFNRIGASAKGNRRSIAAPGLLPRLPFNVNENFLETNVPSRSFDAAKGRTP